MINALCSHCGDPMENRVSQRAKFCSAKCKELDRTERRRSLKTERPCAVCDGFISASAPSHAQACSKACSIKLNNWKRSAAKRSARTLEKRTCVECGGVIGADKRVDARFCSKNCRKLSQGRAWNKRSPSYMRQYLYGMQEGEFEALLERQDGKCAICSSSEWIGKHNKPHVDHDHVTGKIRGLLCGRCNAGIGQFQDDPARLRAAAAYLEASL
jgi:endogenous inhibitor of DNA gyrase (YacG/DUF329 family)